MATHISTLVSKHFPAFTALPRSKRRAVVESVLLYMFRGIGSTDLTDSVRKLDGSAKAFRLALLKDGYAFQIKAFIYYCFCHGINSEHKRFDKAIRHFKIRDADRKVLDILEWSDDLRKLLTKYKKKYKPLSLTTFKSNMDLVAQQVRVYANKYVGKKMRFITSAHHYDIHDLSAELVCHGVQGVMATYPCIESVLHAQNILKRTMHNKGCNVISHYTTQSRGAVYKNKDGTFSSRKLSYETLLNERGVDSDSFLTAGSDGVAVFGTVGDKLENSNDNLIDAQRLLASAKGKRRRLLLLLSGKVDRKFTRWLQENKKLKADEDNEDFYDKVLTSKAEKWKAIGLQGYIQLAMQFLGMSVKKGMRYLESLRVSLGDNMVAA